MLHDNEKADQFQASLMLGFSSKAVMEQFFKSDAVKNLSTKIAIYCETVDAYEIAETITFVKEGKKL